MRSWHGTLESKRFRRLPHPSARACSPRAVLDSFDETPEDVFAAITPAAVTCSDMLAMLSKKGVTFPPNARTALNDYNAISVRATEAELVQFWAGRNEVRMLVDRST